MIVGYRAVTKLQHFRDTTNKGQSVLSPIAMQSLVTDPDSIFDLH